MNIAVILLTSIASSIFVYLICWNIARLAVRFIVFLAVVSSGLYGAFLFLAPENWILINIVVLSVAGISGSGLGLLISSRLSLIAFCVTASVVDIYSAVYGATSSLIDSYREGSSDLLRYLAVSTPISGNINPIIGIGDFLLISAICFALLRMGYRRSLVLLAPLSGLLLAIIVGLIVGGTFAIPFIAATTIVYVSTGIPDDTSSRR